MPRPIGAVFVAGLLVLAGCSGAGAGLGDEGLTFVADPIAVDEDAVGAGGYDVASDEQVSFDREIEIGDRRQRVTVTAHVIHLRRSYRGAGLAHVVVLSLPSVSVLGQRVDLVERIGTTSLLTTAQDSIEGVERRRELPSRTATVLGAERTVEVYRATAERGDVADEVLVHEMSFEHDGNEIVAMAVTPRDAGNGTVLPVLEGVRMA